MKIKHIFLCLGLMLTTNGFASPVVFDCAESCEKYNVEWQDPDSAGECLKLCQQCKKDGGIQYTCSGDALPTCTCETQ